MSEIYCIYKGNQYCADIDIDSSKVEMTSDLDVKGFEPYIDVLGNKHSDIFMKIVKVNEIDLLFSQDYLVKYRNDYFEPFSLTSKALDCKSVLLYTSSEEIAEKMDFSKREQFVFEKSITLDEIEEIRIIKKPILMFKGKETTEEVIKKDSILNWLKTLE
jgi:hypothetical protein